LLLSPPKRYEDVARAVRLARAGADLGQLRAEIDRGLRTRRFLTYRESSGWAIEAEPILAEIRRAVDTSPTNELVELIQRAIGHVVKVILQADDSDGAIGDLARELLDLHALDGNRGGLDASSRHWASVGGSRRKSVNGSLHCSLPAHHCDPAAKSTHRLETDSSDQNAHPGTRWGPRAASGDRT
jgi:hypothetical protein